MGKNMLKQHAERVKIDVNMLLSRHGYTVKAGLLRGNLLFLTMTDSVVVSKAIASLLNKLSNVINWCVYGDTIKLTLE